MKRVDNRCRTSSSPTATFSSCRARPTAGLAGALAVGDRKSTRLNSSHRQISYAVFCLTKKKGRAALDALLARGERIYGVNTGVGRNIKYALAPQQSVRLQENIMRHLSSGTGQPLPRES